MHQYLAERPRLVLGVGITSALIVYHTARHLREKRFLPPGPWPLPIIGSWHLLNFGRVHESLLQVGKRYGDVFTIYVFDQPFIVLNSYSVIKEAFLSAGNQMAGRVIVGEFVDAINEEVFMEDYSEKWKQAKKMGIQAIRRFASAQSGIDKPVMKEIHVLMDTLSELGDTPLNPLSELLKVTERGVAAFMFGMPDTPNIHPELVAHRDSVLEFFDAFHNKYPWEQFYPHWLINWLFPKDKQDFHKAALTLRNHVIEKVKEIQPHIDADNPSCFLEYFLTIRDMEDAGGEARFADTISLYTHDAVHSVAVLVEWALLYLAYYPEVQKEIQALSDKVVGQHDSISLDHRGELGLIDSFLFEVQRHCSYTPVSFAHSVTEDNVTFRGYQFPRNMPIIANLHAIYMDPDLHPDPYTFSPGRFLDKEGRFKKTNTVLTFSIGARACPGENYARLVLFLIAANIVHHFTLEFDPQQPRPSLQSQSNSFFKKPQPFKLVFTRR